jgi:hypothetical protein
VVLPSMHPAHLRAQVFFLHAPFPTAELLRSLSTRDALLEGLIANDVVGFHSFALARHFMEVRFVGGGGGALGCGYATCVGVQGTAVCVETAAHGGWGRGGWVRGSVAMRRVGVQGTAVCV